MRTFKQARRSVSNTLSECVLVLALPAIAGSCSPESSSPIATRRDSAGTEIVENTSNGTWGANTPWVLVETVSIGEVNGSEEYTFNRIADVSLAAGHVFVLDAGDLVVKRYSVSGTHTATFGGPGQGPGELQIPLALTIASDTVVVLNALPTKLVRYTLDGAPSGETAVSINPIRDGFTRSLAALGGGYAFELVTGCRSPMPDDPRPRWKLLTNAHNATSVDTVISNVARNQLAIYANGTCTSLTAFAQPNHSVTFSRDGTMYYSSGESYEIRVYAPDTSNGTLRYVPSPDRIIRRMIDPNPVTQDAWQEYEKAVFGLDPIRNDPNRQSVVRAAWDSIGRPKIWPAIGQLTADDDGFLWVRRIADAGAPQELDVFASDGSFMGTLRLPQAIQLEAIADGMVWGILTDGLGVQTLKGYAIRGRPQDSSRQANMN